MLSRLVNTLDTTVEQGHTICVKTYLLSTEHYNALDNLCIFSAL